jgi:hypothetical protein
MGTDHDPNANKGLDQGFHKMMAGPPSALLVLRQAEIGSHIARSALLNSALLEALKELLSHPSDDQDDAVTAEDGGQEFTLTPRQWAERRARQLVEKIEGKPKLRRVK